MSIKTPSQRSTQNSATKYTHCADIRIRAQQGSGGEQTEKSFLQDLKKKKKKKRTRLKKTIGRR